MLREEWWCLPPRGKAEQSFDLEKDEDGCITAIRHPKDTHNMNFIRSGRAFGEVSLPPGLKVTRQLERDERGRFHYLIRIQNTTAFDVFAREGEIQIALPLAENEGEGREKLSVNCHAHIQCALDSSYILAFRRSGEAPHLGIVLEKGQLDSYSVERAEGERGVFLLQTPARQFRPKEERVLCFGFFWFTNQVDAKRRLLEEPSILSMKSKHFIFYPREHDMLYMQFPGGREDLKTLHVRRNGEDVPYECWADSMHGFVNVSVTPPTDALQELFYEVWYRDRKTALRILVHPDPIELAKRRIRFMVTRQQYRGYHEALDGAFLVYDNERDLQYYSHENKNMNAASGRVSMGLLLARYLRYQDEEAFRDCLKIYEAFLGRELVNEATGEVHADIRRSGISMEPWLALFYAEYYELTGDVSKLLLMYRILKYYYEEGAPVGKTGILPTPSVHLLKKAGFEEEANNLLRLYLAYGEMLGDLTPEDVAFRSTKTASSALFLYGLYRLTGEEEYRDRGDAVLRLLLAMQGEQPDYRLFEVSIPYDELDGFTGHPVSGESFPNSRSAITGLAMMEAARIHQDEALYRRGENTLRACTALIQKDGRASTAYVFADCINGNRVHGCDPYANDQDFGLYLLLNEALRNRQEKKNGNKSLY